MADRRLDLIVRAATNNAALCDAVCRSHGIAGRFETDAWTSPFRTPPRYPDAVTRSPSVDRDQLLDRVDERPGCSVKDSFATLDLSVRPGWSVLFEATWVAHPPLPGGTAGADGDAAWEPVVDPDALAEWAAAWSTDDDPPDLWRPEVLDEDLIVIAGRRDAQVVAGAVVNVAADVVGISNLFGSGSAVDPWRSCLDWIGEHLASRPVVGYESGLDLTDALDHGFEPVGPLRIWTREDT